MRIQTFEAKVKKILGNNLHSITYGYSFEAKKRRMRDVYIHYFNKNGLHKCELDWTLENMIKKLENLK